MKQKIFTCLFTIVLISFPLTTLARSEANCNFEAPTGLLQPTAYRAYTYRQAENNEAVESAIITKDTYIEIQQNQCVDFLVKKFTFTIKSAEKISLVDFSIKEVSSLKFLSAAMMPTDLLIFLKRFSKKGKTEGHFSACKNGTSALPGQCSWDSTGGYTFDAERENDKVVIVITEYISG